MRICQACGAERGSRCPNCKRNAYHQRLGRDVSRACSACRVRRPLASSGECHACLKSVGLKECAACRRILVVLLSFKPRQGSCRDCLRSR